MTYTVYTDGAYSEVKKVVGCAYLITTDKTFVSCDSVRVETESSPTQAEMLAVGLACAYFIDNCNLSEEDEIVFNIDSLYAVKLCNEYKSSFKGKYIKYEVDKRTLKLLQKLSKICKVEIRKVKGHKDKLNSNMFVDRLAKVAVRRG